MPSAAILSSMKTNQQSFIDHKPSTLGSSVSQSLDSQRTTSTGCVSLGSLRKPRLRRVRCDARATLGAMAIAMLISGRGSRGCEPACQSLLEHACVLVRYTTR